MKPGEVRVCPSCGTRNKPKWDYCVSCGEALEGVPMGFVQPVTIRTTAVQTEAPVARAGGPSALGTVLGLAIAIGAGLLLWRWTREAASADAAAFGAPLTARQPTLPSPGPAKSLPGEDDFKAGYGLLVRGQAAEAAERLALAVEAAPDNPQYRNVYAKALQAAGSVEDALAQYEEAVRLKPDDVTYLVDLGTAQDMAGNRDTAMATYERVLSLAPSDAQVLHNVARVHIRSERFDKALPFLQRLTESRRGDPVAKQDLGWALEKTGDLAGAEAVYSEIIALVPAADVTRGRLAEVLLKQGRGAEAVAVFRAGLESNPESPLLRRGLASLLERTGRIQEAVTEYREYARLAPNAADAKSLAERADKIEKRITAGS
jgi:Flp pilus assembly protein TadD